MVQATTTTSTFGRYLPKHFMDKYVFGARPTLTAQDLQSDIDSLISGAQSGFKLRPPCAGDDNDDACSALAVPGQQQSLLDSWMRTAERFTSYLGLQKRQEDQAWEIHHQQDMLDKSLKEQAKAMEQQQRDMARQLEDMKKQQERMKEQKETTETQQRMVTEQKEAFEKERRDFEEGQRKQRERIEEQRREMEEARRRQAAERRRLFSFTAAGDPRLCPIDENGDVIDEFCIEYKGPATVMCYDERGALQSIDFVGVTHEDGTCPQCKDADFVGEQWRFLPPSFREVKYRNVTAKHVHDVSCANDWESEARPSRMPSGEWLKAFDGGHSFVLHALQPRIVDGPSFNFIWSLMMQKAGSGIDFDREHVGMWLNSILTVQGYAKEHGLKGTALEVLSQWVVLYGIAAHMKV